MIRESGLRVGMEKAVGLEAGGTGNVSEEVKSEPCMLRRSEFVDLKSLALRGRSSEL